jgi:CRISPR-associated protein Csd2
MNIPEIIKNPAARHEFVLLFEAVNSNPNGDPDSGNLPRVDPETMHGLVTDVALKRKIRDYLSLTQNENIFIQSKVALNTLIEQVGKDLDREAKGNKRADEDVQKGMCERFFDVRMFGAVLSTGKLNAGQVRGPVQLTFAKSVDPVFQLELSITRQARTTEERMETGSTEMGRKAVVPYGLYLAKGYFNPFLAKTTGVSSNDLTMLWTALCNLFDYDRSAARPEMTVRGVYVFTHENEKGNAPAHKLLERVKVDLIDKTKAPRAFSDYTVNLDESEMPNGVTLTRLLEG